MDNDAQQNRFISAIGYVPPLCLLPLLLKKNSAFAQHHGKQGLVLLIAWCLISLTNIVPILGAIFSVVGYIVFVILMILGIINALNGRYWEMPILGEYAKQIKI